jgi:hypothetical protein
MSDDESVNVPVAPVEKRGRGAPKGKRTPTPAQLETLAKARHRAAEIRKLRTIVELEDIIAEKKATMPELTRFEPEIILPPNQIKPVPTEKVWYAQSASGVAATAPEGEPPPDLPNPCESIVTPDEMKNTIKKKKKTRIIIEQSSSDEDVFENTDDVIFVKRRGRKDPPKKEVIPEPEPPPKVDPYAHSASGVAAYMQPIKTTKFTSEVNPSYFNKRFY